MLQFSKGEDMNNYKIKIASISCSNCAKTITNHLQSKYPEANVRVNVASKLLLITTDASQNEIEEQLIAINYPPSSHISKKQQKRNQIELSISIVISIYFLIGMIIHIASTEQNTLFTNVYLQFILASFIQFYIARKFYVNSYMSIRQKVLGMDFLITFSTTITYLFSVYLMFSNNQIHPYFETSSLIITIILVGKAIEDIVKNNAIDLLDQTDNISDTIITLEDGQTMIAQNIEPGTSINIGANKLIAIDSIITNGITQVDESAITGESRLVDKKVGDFLYAGTINIDSQIIATTQTYSEDSYLYKILDSIESAELIDTNYQRIADKIASIFVPLIIFIGILTFITTFIFTNDSIIAFERAMSVIVISCPCALGLATPTSVLVSNSISAKLGIIYKDGKFFELADQIDVVCFDKTGTLTQGAPSIYETTISDHLLPYVYALSSKSNHPISLAITNEYKQYDQNIDLTVEHLNGIGLNANCDEVSYQLGNRKLLTNRKHIDDIISLEKEGYTVNVLLINNKYEGYIKLSDQIRDDAHEIIARLRARDIKIAMITGDNQSVANIIADKLGIDLVYAETLPDQKMKIVKQIQKDYKTIAFVGDGINDSGSLKTADVGISVAKASDIAKAASDMTITSDNLNLIDDAINLSKLTRRNIKHSLMWAFSYNLIAIPLAALGFLNMVWAAVFMGFSSIVVVLNSLHLKQEFKKAAINKISNYK